MWYREPYHWKPLCLSLQSPLHPIPGSPTSPQSALGGSNSTLSGSASSGVSSLSESNFGGQYPDPGPIRNDALEPLPSHLWSPPDEYLASPYLHMHYDGPEIDSMDPVRPFHYRNPASHPHPHTHTHSGLDSHSHGPPPHHHIPTHGPHHIPYRRPQPPSVPPKPYLREGCIPEEELTPQPIPLPRRIFHSPHGHREDLGKHAWEQCISEEHEENQWWGRHREATACVTAPRAVQKYLLNNETDWSKDDIDCTQLYNSSVSMFLFRLKIIRDVSWNRFATIRANTTPQAVHSEHSSCCFSCRFHNKQTAEGRYSQSSDFSCWNASYIRIIILINLLHSSVFKGLSPLRFFKNTVKCSLMVNHIKWRTVIRVAAGLSSVTGLWGWTCSSRLGHEKAWTFFPIRTTCMHTYIRECIQMRCSARAAQAAYPSFCWSALQSPRVCFVWWRCLKRNGSRLDGRRVWTEDINMSAFMFTVNEEHKKNTSHLDPLLDSEPTPLPPSRFLPPSLFLSLRGVRSAVRAGQGWLQRRSLVTDDSAADLTQMGLESPTCLKCTQMQFDLSSGLSFSHFHFDYWERGKNIYLTMFLYGLILLWFQIVILEH